MKITRRTMLKTTAAAGMMAAAKAHAQQPAAPAGRKASICFRIGAPIWQNEARFNELLALFDKNTGVADEITLFTSETHPPLPLNVILERMPVMQARMEAARARGYRSGINVLSTLGHHEENLPNSLSGEFTPMTDINGGVCRGSFCPNGEPMRAYIASVYEAVAGAKPDYIWIDDDVRLYGHMPIGAGCFCDTCVQKFSKSSGKAYTRESLRAAFNAEPVADQLALRKAYLQHNRDTISELFRLIEKTVHAKSPGMPLGFMTGDRFFEGYDFDTWAGILAGPGRAPVLWRPGGGTYTDERLASITDKAHDIGRQVSVLPDYVTCIQSELESFPYQRLKKSEHATALEAAAYIASGCTGTAFNVLSQYDEPLDEYTPLVGRLARVRPFLDALAAELGRATPEGIHSGWCKDFYTAQNVGGPWLGGPIPPSHCNEIYSTGLPAAYSAGGARVTAFSGDQALALPEEEILSALRSGVYLDGPALVRLHEMGYGDLLGFKVAEVRHIDCIEELTNHEINGAFAGRRRNGRQSFWKCPTYVFEPTADGAQAISRCVDYTYAETAPCCMGVFENREGGRVCVAGYYPYEQLQNLSKSAQLKSVMRWLSRDALPAYVASFHRINLWVRRPQGRIAIALLNASLDPAENVELLVRTEKTNMSFTTEGGTESATATGADGPYRRFVLPTMQPWEVALAVVKNA